MIVREIRFYRTSFGRSPAKRFLDSLSGKQAQKIVWVLGLIEELDSVPTQYLKKLRGTNELWEVRAQFGGDSFRLLGFFDGPDLLVVTNGFAKKQNKTPRRAISLAEERKREYLSRKHYD